MKKADLGCLTERHLLLFGTVIQWFARYEWLMQEVMATAAGSDSGSVMLLTRGLDFSGKRQALFDLLCHRTVPLDRYDRINGYLMVPHTLTPLRDDVAHSAWLPPHEATSHHRSRRSPSALPASAIMPIPMVYQVATKSGLSSVQCMA